jgi:hypothetical protein
MRRRPPPDTATPERDAELLIAEQWAIPVAQLPDIRGTSLAPVTDRADDTPPRRIRLVARSDRNRQRR